MRLDLRLNPASVTRQALAAAEAGATEPSQFASNGWSVADLATNGDARFTITTLPSDGGSAITALQYRVGSGGSWVAFSGTTTGTYDIAGFTDGSATDVYVRAVNAVGNGTASALKSVTTTGVPDQFASNGWSVADLATTTDARFTITTLPAANGSAITALQYRVGAGGTWTSFSGATTGTYDIAGFTDNLATDVYVRAVNAVGNGTASASKSVTTTGPYVFTNAEAESWVTRSVEGISTTPTYYKSALDTLVSSLKAGANSWGVLTWIAVGLTRSKNDVLLDLKQARAGTWINEGNDNWVNSNGMAGNGTNASAAIIDCGVTWASLMSQNSAHFGARIRDPGNDAEAFIGQSNISTDKTRLIYGASGNIGYRINSTTTGAITVTHQGAATSAHMIVNRSASTTTTGYMNGVAGANDATASASVSTVNVYIGANGTSLRGATLWDLIHIGGSLSQTQVTELTAAVLAFVNAVQRREVHVLFSGQSNSTRMFLDAASGTGSGDGSANSNTITRKFAPRLQTAIETYYNDSRPVTLSVLNISYSSASVLNLIGTNYFLNPGGNRLADAKTAMTAALRYNRASAIYIVWQQGEAESSYVSNPSVTDWTTETLNVWGPGSGSLREHINTTRGFTGTVPVIVAPLGPTTDVSSVRLADFRSHQNVEQMVPANNYVTADTLSVQRVATNDVHAVGFNVSTAGYDALADIINDRLIALFYT